MVFIDNAKIWVKAGKGGNGCNSFIRSRFNRYPKRNGGDGGAGGSIILRGDKDLLTLYDFKLRQHFYAASGGHGSSNRKKGKDAQNTVIPVPLGTTVIECSTGCKLRDIISDGQELTVAKGGEAGQGNVHNRLGDFLGHPGEEKELILDLKVIADIGLVGFPNSGKSTLISMASGARPKIAAYPFTTKAPVLGVVNFGDSVLTMADIPGLIKGSHSGKGLGIRFLRHIERTRLLVHMIDMAGSDGRDPAEDYRVINRELEAYSNNLLKLPTIIVANKMDLAKAQDNLRRFKKEIKKKIIPISALKGEGIKELIDAIKKRI